ncbi:uncharacterized protein LOC129258462 [Lytechinus pictus]|uniref:uncharacterized protein LOC129258462 n=1 Tax=Lytechinus pictus TaxID=7653 RepID=UPI0030B9F9B1
MMEIYASSRHLFLLVCVIGSMGTTLAAHRPLRMVVKEFRIPLNQNAADLGTADQSVQSQNGASVGSSTSTSAESEESQQPSDAASAANNAVGTPADAANRLNPIKRIIPDHYGPSVGDPYRKSAQDNHWHFRSSTTLAVAALGVALVALIASLGVGAAIMSQKNRQEAATGFLRTEGYVEMLEIPTYDEQELCRNVNS